MMKLQKEEHTSAIFIVCKLLRKENPQQNVSTVQANLIKICEIPEFAQNIAGEIVQRLAEKRGLTQIDFESLAEYFLNKKRREVFAGGFHTRLGSDSVLWLLQKNPIYNAKPIKLMLSYLDGDKFGVGEAQAAEKVPDSKLITGVSKTESSHPIHQKKVTQEKEPDQENSLSLDT
jgi:hypothetical protein